MVLGGQVGKINDAWKEGRFTLVVSEDIISEYLDVLSRPKLHLTADLVSTILAHVQRKAETVTPTESIDAVAVDPSDNKFLETAAAAKVDCIVSGDNHLLNLRSFRGIPILTARDFIERVSG